MKSLNVDLLQSLNAFFARNPGVKLSPEQLAVQGFLDSLGWIENEREALIQPLRGVARIAPLIGDPQRAASLVAAGYTSAACIAAQSQSVFVAAMEPHIGAQAAWSIYHQAQSVRSRVAQQWMRIREAASPYGKMLSSRTRTNATANGSASSVANIDYASIFGEAPLMDVPHDMSILGPAAYFADLMGIVDRTITQANPGLGALGLSNRRRDLWNLLLTPGNTSDMVSNADLVVEILESTLAALGLTNAAFLVPATPLGAPPSVCTGSEWPNLIAPGTTYIVDNGSQTGPVLTGEIDVSVTIRGGRSIQSISIDSVPLVIGAQSSPSRAPSVVLEGLSFSFAANATASSLLWFAGGELTLRNCVLISSSSASDGWAIDCQPTASGLGPSGLITLENCTIVDLTPEASTAAINASTTGPLTISMLNCIVWPTSTPLSYAAIKVSSSVAMNIDYCDLFAGSSSIVREGATGGSLIDFGSANFSLPPIFTPTTPLIAPYTQLEPSSPCIGRGRDGASVGACVSVYSALAWSVYPLDLPFNLEQSSGGIALKALETSLDEINSICAPVCNGLAQNLYFPLSQLGLSLADYLLLQTPLTDPSNIAPDYGLSSFDTAAVVLLPSMASAATWTFPAAPFAKRIGCTIDQLRDLIYQDLSPAEIAEGIHFGAGMPSKDSWLGFYVNGYGTSGCNTLTLVTQYVPVGRMAVPFAPAQLTAVVIPALPTPPATSFTISFWMCWDSGQTLVALNIGGTKGLTWQVDAGVFSLLTNGQTVHSIDLSSFQTLPQWVHVATTYNAVTRQMETCINGQAAASSPGVFQWPGGVITLGATQQLNTFFSGCLCDLSVWNVARTQPEIAATFQRPTLAKPATAVTPGPPSLLGYWPVNDQGAVILNWTAVAGINGQLTGSASPSAIGLPNQNVAPSILLTEGQCTFVQVELLSGNAANGPTGVTAGNLDRIHRFVRLAARMKWSFADLDWALFTVFRTGAIRNLDFTMPYVFAELARMNTLIDKLDIDVVRLCAILGILKPFGRGRFGDALPLFDLVYNRPPLAATMFSPDMSLELSIANDFDTPGPVALRVAALLDLAPLQLAALARLLAQGDGLALNESTLTALFRYRTLAGWVGTNVFSFLDLLDLMPRTTFATACMSIELLDFVETVLWIKAAGLEPSELRYILRLPSEEPSGPYEQNLEFSFLADLPHLRTRLELALNSCRIGPPSFISPVTGALESAALFESAVKANYVDESGLITSTFWALLPSRNFHVPSSSYSTIGQAISSAVASLNAGAAQATVLVAPGVYDRPDDVNLQVELTQGMLVLQSESGPTATVIKCGSSSFIQITQNGSGSFVMRGFTVQGGSSTTANGVAISSTCSLQLSNCIFQNNISTNGGAIALVGTQQAPVTLDALNCVFFNNQASSSGGALYLVYTSATLTFCTLYANLSANNVSNGIYLDPNSQLTLSQTIAWDNPATGQNDWSGGGIVTCIDSDLNAPSLDSQGQPAVGLGTAPPPQNCIFVDPELVAAEQGLFQPKPGSPCLNHAEDGQTIGYGGDTGLLAAVPALYPFAYAQIAALRATLARLFKNEELPFDAVLSALGPHENGLELLAPAADTSAAVAYVRKVHQTLLLAARFNLDDRLLSLVFAQPWLLSLSGNAALYRPNFTDLHTLARLSELLSLDEALKTGLVSYLEAAANKSQTTPSVKALAALFGWDITDLEHALAATHIACCLRATSTTTSSAVLQAIPVFSTPVPLTDLTFEAWVCVAPVNSNAQTGAPLVAYSSAAQSGQWALMLGIAPESSCPWFQVQDAAGNSSAVIAKQVVLQPGTWCHLCGVFQQQTISLYVNGNLSATGAPNSKQGALSIASPAPMVFANDPAAAPVAGINSIAEVRLWTIARTPDQIRAGMNSRISLRDTWFSSILGYWTFADNRWTDLTGNWLPGSVTGSVSQSFNLIVPVSLSSILAANRLIGYSGRTGIDLSLVFRLFTDGLVFGADGAAPLLDCLEGADLKPLEDAMAAISVLKRDKLKRFAMHQINALVGPLGFPVRSDNDLSDYLLTDIDMGEETSSSRIVQATLSLQQYVQRCRLCLEPGVSNVDLTDREWEWMDSYREWEANRKVFLFPESYLRPELRRDKTPPFVEIERALSNAEPTLNGIERITKRYLDEFSVAASLTTVGAWYQPAERIDSYVSLHSNPSISTLIASPVGQTALALSAFTIEAWFSSANDLSGEWGMSVVQLSTHQQFGGRRAFSLGIFGAGGSPQFGVQDESTGQIFSVSAPTISACGGQWYHLCGVFNNGAITLYVNGTPGSPLQLTSPTFNVLPSQLLILGMDPMIGVVGAERSNLAELRFFKTARSQQQILASMNRRIATYAPDFADLIGYWQFANGSLVDLTQKWATRGANDVSFGFPEKDAFPTSSAAVNTYHFLGRTRTKPFTYYHREREMHSTGSLQVDAAAPNSVWSAWNLIPLTINSPYATPVILRGRLYIFWVEVREVAKSSHSEPVIEAHREITIQYSWRNSDGSWFSPQSPFPVISTTESLESNRAWRRVWAAPCAVGESVGILVVYGPDLRCFVLRADGTVIADLSLGGITKETLSYSSICARSFTVSTSQSIPTPSSTRTLSAVSGLSILAANYDWVDTGIVTAATRAPGSAVAVIPSDFAELPVMMSPGPGTFALSVDPWGMSQGDIAWFLFPPDDQTLGVYASVDPRMPWTTVTTNILGSATTCTGQPSSVLWNDIVYCAVPVSGPMIGSVVAIYSMASLGASLPWQAVHTIASGIFTAVLCVGEDGNLYCFYYANSSPTSISVAMCDKTGKWNDSVTSIPVGTRWFSKPAYWNGQWYLAAQNASGSGMCLYQASTLGGTWQVCGPPIVQSAGSVPGALVAFPNGLVLTYSSNSQNLTAIFTTNPAAGSWQNISVGGSVFKNMVFVSSCADLFKLPGIPGNQLLSSVPADADCLPVGNQLGSYIYQSGGSEFLIEGFDPNTNLRLDAQVQVSVSAAGLVSISAAIIPALGTANFSFHRLTSTAVRALTTALAEGGMDSLLSTSTQLTLEAPLAAPTIIGACVCPSRNQQISFALSSAFGIYYREIFFFVPWLVAAQLQRIRMFKEARRYFEYIFKPSAVLSGEDYWRCVWLQGATPKSTLEALEWLDPVALSYYRDDPFNANVIAELRPSAYLRAIVTAYIQNIISWGDDLFTGGTREYVNQASQLYRYAADLLGPRPRRIAYMPPAPQTYVQLSAAEENEFLIAIEEIAAINGSPAPLPEGTDPNGSVANTGFYFGVPENPEFIKNWDIVFERLGMIRAGLDMQGATAEMPLFEPPLSVSDILARSAAGLGAPAVSATAADEVVRNEERFNALLISARMMANSVVEFGGSLLRALESNDADGLALLQVSQQTQISSQLRQIRVEEVNNLARTIDSLQAGLQAAIHRRDFYRSLSAAGWSSAETDGTAMARESIENRKNAAGLNAAAVPLHLIPIIYGLATGGASIGASMQSAAAAAGDVAAWKGEKGALSNIIASYERRAQEWTFQQRIAEFDINQINAQIKAAERQQESARLQFSLEETSLAQSLEVQDYYRSRFNNGDLYGWMADTLGSLYQQIYQVALSVAQLAQSTLIDITHVDHSYVDSSTWNSKRRGLLAGECLVLDLARMEEAYLQWQRTNSSGDVTKSISLKSHDPLAYLQLVNTGVTTFELTEELFDRDHPGHYARKIKMLSVAMPSIKRNPAGVNASLVRVSHDIVRHPDPQAVDFLLGHAANPPGRSLRRGVQPRRYALSHAGRTSGSAVDGFQTAQFDAFAGSGAVSKWRLEFPVSSNRVNLRDIDDVILNLNYTAEHGDDSFRHHVESSLPPFYGAQLVDIAHDFPEAWMAFRSGNDDALSLPPLDGLFPRKLSAPEFQLHSIHIGAFSHAGVAQELPAFTLSPGTESALLLLPQAEVRHSVASIFLNDHSPRILAQSWKIAIVPSENFQPSNRSALDIWLLVEFSESSPGEF